MTRPPLNDDLAWARHLSLVAPRIYVSGELQGWDKEQREHLDEWVKAGITTYLDLRGEANDAEFVREHSPHIRYHTLGVIDDGESRDHRWFESGTGIVSNALDSGSDNVLIGCSMGISRSTSMAFAVLISRGYEPLDALKSIHSARPVATFLYAMDALDWWYKKQGIGSDVTVTTRQEITKWLAEETGIPYWAIAHETGRYG